MALELPVWFLPGLGAIALAAVAGWVLWLNPRSLPGRAFAAFLLLRGVAGLFATLAESGPSQDARIHVSNVAAGFALGASAIIFLSVYPRRRAWGRPVVWAVLGGVLLLLALAVAAAPARVADAMRALGLATSPGPVPLLAVGPGLVLLLGLVLIRFAVDFARERDARLRDSLLLVTLGLGSYMTYLAALLTTSRVLGRPIPLADAGALGQALGAGAALCGLAALAILVRSAAKGTARERTLIFLFAVLPAATGAFATFLPGTFASTSGAVGFFRGLWRLPLPILATYALVRNQLFDIDTKVKWTIRRGTIAAVFIGVFFVVAQLAQDYFTSEYGWAIGGVAAGLLLFAITPLQRMAERVANVAVPTMHETRAGASADEAYRAALEMALEDRVITRAEERALARLAAKLGIDAARALELREEVERAAGVPAT